MINYPENFQNTNQLSKNTFISYAAIFLFHKPPQTDNWLRASIVGYRLRLAIEGSEQWQYVFVDCGLEIEITDLISDLMYVVMVQAYNFFGSGPWSSPAFVFLENGTHRLNVQMGVVWWTFL